MRCLILATISTVLLMGCKPQQRVPVQTVERKVTTLVPYRLPGDSVLMQAKFECDSTNNVLLKQLAESKTGMTTGYEFENSTLSYSAKTARDTIYIPQDSIIIEQEIPVLLEVPKIEYRQTYWQRIRSTIGDLALIFLLIFSLFKLIIKR